MIGLLYQMVAWEDLRVELRAALEDLAAELQALPGFQGAELMENAQALGRFAFLERWVSRDAYAQAGPSMPKAVLSQVMALLDCPPERTIYEIHPHE